VLSTPNNNENSIVAIFFALLCIHSDSGLAVTFMTLAIGLMGLEGAGYGANAMEIAPRYAGIIFGVSNTVATIPGIGNYKLFQIFLIPILLFSWSCDNGCHT